MSEDGIKANGIKKFKELLRKVLYVKALQNDVINILHEIEINHDGMRLTVERLEYLQKDIVQKMDQLINNKIL